MKRSIYIGWDPREAAAFTVARASVLRHLSDAIPVHGLVLADLQDRGLYFRKTERRGGRIYDLLSRRADYDGAMSTEFAISRFLTPALAGSGWALFMDCDMLVRDDLAQLFDSLDPQYALYCVKHDYRPAETEKMDGQKQTQYGRKNWSSFMAFNCDHYANKMLVKSVDIANTRPGVDLHQFFWLQDKHIGALDEKWNWLAGHSDPDIEPAVVHHTAGGPALSGYDDVAFSDEWRAELRRDAIGPVVPA